MIGDKLKDRISGEILSFDHGTVLNSYYSLDGMSMYADVVVSNNDGQQQRKTKVPILKTGGLSSSLPPVGSTAVVGTIDNNENKPFIIGYFESTITKKFVEDYKRPRKPPLGMTR